MTRALLVALLLVGCATPTIAQEITPPAWETARGLMTIQHYLVTIDGPGMVDLLVQTPPDLPAPPLVTIKRKTARQVQAEPDGDLVLHVLGWHPDTGIMRLRLIDRAEREATWHLAVYCAR